MKKETLSDTINKFACECIEQACMQAEAKLQIAVVQALKSGDFASYIHTGLEPEIVYAPYSGIERLRQENKRLVERAEEMRGYLKQIVGFAENFTVKNAISSGVKEALLKIHIKAFLDKLEAE